MAKVKTDAYMISFRTFRILLAMTGIESRLP